MTTTLLPFDRRALQRIADGGIPRASKSVQASTITRLLRAGYIRLATVRMNQYQIPGYVITDNGMRALMDTAEIPY